jgi:hypothetical protein
LEIERKKLGTARLTSICATFAPNYFSESLAKSGKVGRLVHILLYRFTTHLASLTWVVQIAGESYLSLPLSSHPHRKNGAITQWILSPEHDNFILVDLLLGVC